LQFENRMSQSVPKAHLKLLANYGAPTFSLVGSVVLAISCILSSANGKGEGFQWLFSTIYGRCFILGAFLSLVGGGISLSLAPLYKGQEAKIEEKDQEIERKAQEITSLSQELQQKTKELENDLELEKRALESQFAARKKGYSRILNDELKVLTYILGFGSNDRISLYRHDKRNNRFIMFARHSQNPRLKQPGKVFYPDDYGCLGQTWEYGSCFIEFPEPGTPQYYRTCESEWNMDRQTVDEITMKCRVIGGIAIENLNYERIAVLIFESTRTGAFREKTIRTLMSTHAESMRITYLLERIGNIQPDLIYAYEEGF